MHEIPNLIGSKLVFQNKHQKVIVDTLELEGNQWEQVYFVKPNKNGVGILPVDNTGIYLINQYRHASHSFLWQIPSGMINVGSSEIETAKHELLEEAGLLAKEYVKIGSILAEPGMSDQEEFIYLAKNLEKREQNLEISEVIEDVKHFTFLEIDRMVKNGEIKCGFTLSALLLYKNNYLL